MTFSVSEQMLTLLYAVILGVLLGFLYDNIKAVRIVLNPSNVPLLIIDLIFMIICAFCTGLFSMAFSLGDTRYFTVFGEIVGFSLIHFTLGRVCIRLFEKVYGFVYKKVKKILGFIGKFAKKLLKVTLKLMYNKSRLLDTFNRRSVPSSESATTEQ